VRFAIKFDMAPDDKSTQSNAQYALNLGLAGFAGQVGCVTLAVILGALFLGLWLDNQFHTRPLFTILILLGSVPITIFLMFRLALGAIAKIKLSQPAKKEEKSSE